MGQHSATNDGGQGDRDLFAIGHAAAETTSAAKEGEERMREWEGRRRGRRGRKERLALDIVLSTWCVDKSVGQRL